jgi:phosphatidylserine synthase
MIKNIARGYGRLFKSAGKILLLLSLCIALGCVIVFPLWKFATALPAVYTAIVLAVISLILLYLIAKKIRTAGFKQVLLAALRILLIASCLFLCAWLVLSGRRVLALPVLALTFVLYGILSFGIREKNAQNEADSR